MLSKMAALDPPKTERNKNANEFEIENMKSARNAKK